MYIRSMANDKIMSVDIHEFVEWDTVNWGKAIRFWEDKIEFKTDYKCLELGSNRGGLSLWMGIKGMEVICSDLDNPQTNAEPMHNKREGLNISYEAINALEIPYENAFDIIVFKSVLGGASRGGSNENKQLVMDQIYKALKPGGKLLFAENLRASGLHRFFRSQFVKWGNDWNYLQIPELKKLLKNFSRSSYQPAGFFGAFGRSEKQRQVLGKLDNFIEKLFSKNQHYLVFGIAEK